MEKNELSVIKYEGSNNFLVHKYHITDLNTFSQLIVHETQEAIFFKNGEAIETFTAGKYTLTTENLPFLKKIINAPTGGDSPFHCEVYFINKVVSMNINWGTNSQFPIMEPTFQIPINVGTYGSLEFVIKESKKFLLKLVGTEEFITTETIQAYFKEKITMRVKTYLSKIMAEISYLNITQHLEEISLAIKNTLNNDFDEYGINLKNFYISTINIPEGDIQKLKELLNKKLEYKTLNYNWADEQIADITKRYASNEGNANNIGGMISTMPVALAFGEMLKNNIGDFTENGINFSGKDISNASTSNKVNNQTTFYCIKCGNKLTQEMVFCSKCGTKIEGEKQYEKNGL